MNETQTQDKYWQAFRSEMPVTSRLSYLDHAAVAPLPEPARQAITTWCNEAAELGDTVWARWAERVSEIRRLAARLLGSQEEEIGFVPSTTAGISLVAEGMPWSNGDNMVTLANEFPSNLYPWMNLTARGVESRRVPVDEGIVDLERIMQHCDARTRLISVSWVGYSSGWRIDVGALCELAHRRGILVFLDAIQGLGVFPLNVHDIPIDFLAADGHKWMLGPEGAGLLYVRREHLQTLRPLMVGWNSVVQAHDFDHIELKLRNSASRYEGGSQNMVGVLALGASLALLERMGLASRESAIAERILSLTDTACRRLEQSGARLITRRAAGHDSGIVVFDVPHADRQSVRQRCLEAGVVLSCRGGGLRISPHAYCDATDLDRLIEVLGGV